MSTPILGLTELASAQSQPHLIVNANTRALEAVARGTVLTVGDNAPPGSPADGDMHVVGTSATGDWSGHDDELALYTVNGWIFFTPATEQLVRNADDGEPYRYTGSAWAVWEPVGDAAPLSPDTIPDTPDDFDDEFEYGSTLDTTGARRASAASWSVLNTSGTDPVLSVENGALVITAGGTTSVGFYALPISGATWKVRAKWAASDHPVEIYSQRMMLAHRSSAGKQVVFGWYLNGSSVFYRGYWRLSSYTWGSTPSETSLSGNNPLWWIPLYVEIEYDGTNLIYRESKSGHDSTFVTIYTEAVATHLGGAADYIGIYYTQASGNTANFPQSLEWIRKVA